MIDFQVEFIDISLLEYCEEESGFISDGFLWFLDFQVFYNFIVYVRCTTLFKSSSFKIAMGMNDIISEADVMLCDVLLLV